MTGSLIVLGATGCIGGSVVAAAVEAGRPVIAVARDGAALDALRASYDGAALQTVVASIGSDGESKTLAAKLRALGEPVSGVIAAVRGDIERGRLLDAPADFLRRRLDEDLLPHLFAARHLLPLLAEQGDATQRGSYVLIGGPGAEQPWAGYGHYSIGAAALRMLARVLKDEARAISVRVQLLAVESPARTAGNARHACSAWPEASAIARRALAMVGERTPRDDAVVRFSGHNAPSALWSDDLDAVDNAAPRAAASRDAKARDTTPAAQRIAQDPIDDARALLRAITASSRLQDMSPP